MAEIGNDKTMGDGNNTLPNVQILYISMAEEGNYETMGDGNTTLQHTQNP